MSADDSDVTASSAAIHTFAEDDMRASREHEQVQNLEIQKKLLEIEIQQLENEIATDSAETFSRDQLSTVKSELEHACNETFAQRTNALLMKLEAAKGERQVLERRAANLRRTLENEQELTRQLADERQAQHGARRPAFPELVLPDLAAVRENCALGHRRRALEDEVREAKRQLALRRQAASNERRLEAVKRQLERKVADGEAQLRRLRALGDGAGGLPPSGFGLDGGSSGSLQ